MGGPWICATLPHPVTILTCHLLFADIYNASEELDTPRGVALIDSLVNSARHGAALSSASGSASVCRVLELEDAQILVHPIAPTNISAASTIIVTAQYCRITLGWLHFGLAAAKTIYIRKPISKDSLVMV